MAVALTEAAFDGEFGFEAAFDMPATWLFAETQSRFVVSVAKENQAAFEALAGNIARHVGQVTTTGDMIFRMQDDTVIVPVKEAKAKWEDAIPCLMK